MTICGLKWVVIIPAIISLVLVTPILLNQAYSHPVPTCMIPSHCPVGAHMGPTLYDNATPILVGTVLAWVSFGSIIVLTGRFVHGRQKNVDFEAGTDEKP